MAAVAVSSMHSAFPGPRSARHNFFAAAVLERPAQPSQLGASGSRTSSSQAQSFASAPMGAFGPASGMRPPQVTFLRTVRRAAPPPPIPAAVPGAVADPFDDAHALPSAPPHSQSAAPDDAGTMRFPRRPSLDVLARHRPGPPSPPRSARCMAYDRTRGQRAVAGILLNRAHSAGQKPLRRAPPVGEGKRAYSPSGLRTMVCVGDL